MCLESCSVIADEVETVGGRGELIELRPLKQDIRRKASRGARVRRGALIPSVSGSMLGGQIGVIQFTTWNVAISRCRSCRTYPHSTTGVTVMVTPSGLKEIFEQRTALLLRISVWKSGTSSRTHGHVPVEAKTAGGRRDGPRRRPSGAMLQGAAPGQPGFGCGRTRTLGPLRSSRRGPHRLTRRRPGQDQWPGRRAVRVRPCRCSAAG